MLDMAQGADLYQLRRPAYNFGLQPGSDQFWLNLTFPIPVWNLNQGNIRAARANIREALELYIEDCREAGDPVPTEANKEFIEVEAA